MAEQLHPLVHHPPSSGLDRPHPALDPSLEVQDGPEELPLEPLAPEVAVPAPVLLSVAASSAAFRWDAASWALPPHDERQAEYQARCEYTLEYELQLQQADVGPPTPALPAEQLMQQLPQSLKDGAWKAVAFATGPQQELLQVTGLRAGRFYATRLVATARASVDGSVVAYFPAASSAVVPFRTTPTAPGQMQAPALAQRARNALKLKWGLPDETGGEAISQYELLVAPAPAGWDGPPPDEQGFCQVYAGDERSFKLGKLGPGQRFSFRIRPLNVLGWGPWSLPSTFTTQASVPAQPDPPLQIAATKDTTTLQWSSPPDNGSLVTCYQLEVDDGSGGEFRLAYTGPQQRCVVKQLQSGLHYRYRLRAENSEGYSLWSPIAAATTAATVPGSPTGLSAVGVNRASVTLAWQPPVSDGGSPVLGYQVQLQAKTKVAAASLGNDWIVIFDGTAVATTFSALQAGCQYLVRVAARNAAGEGQFCLPLQVTTAPDAPLPPVMLDAEVAATSLLLRWAAPAHDGGAAVSGYKVEMRCSPSAASAAAPGAISPQHSLAIPEHFLSIYSGPDTCVQVTDLLPGTAYEFRAAALNSHGAGGWCDVGTAATLPAAPLPPPAPMLVGASAHGLSVAWVEPYAQGSPVTCYTLNMARLGPASSSSSSAATANGHADGGHHHADAHDDEASSSSGSCGVAPCDRLRWETVYTGPAATADVKQLRPASRYALRVRAHNSIGGSSWGETLTACTGPAAPGPPGGLAAEALSSSEMALSWAPPAEDNGSAVTGYQLEVASGSSSAASSGGAGGSASWSKVWQGAATTHAVGGLQPGRSYVWRLRALSSCGAGPWCEPVRATTSAAAPDAPGRPAFSQRTATSVKAKWSMPLEDHGASVSGYELALRQAGGQQQGQQQQQQQAWQTVYRGPELSHRVTGLQPGCSYELRVAAANAAGTGPWSDAGAVATLLRPPAAPAAPDVQLVATGGNGGGAAGLLADWAAPEASPDCAEAIAYEVEASPPPGAPAAAGVVKASVSRSTQASLSGLLPGVTYSVRVRAVGAEGAGHSAWSGAAALAVPAAPAAPAAQLDSDGSNGAAPPGALVPAGKRPSKARASKAAPKKPADKVRMQAVLVATAKTPRKAGKGWSQYVPRIVRQLYKKLGPLFCIALVVLVVLVALFARSWWRG